MFNKEDLEEGTILMQMMNIKSDQIIVLKAKDESKVEDLKAALEKVKEGQMSTWETYLPDQYELVKANKIQTQGNYVLYVTSSQAEEIVKIFEEQVK